LSDVEFDQSIESLASFLFLNTASRAATVFDHCRESSVPEDGESRDASLLRTFGLTSIGGPQTPAVALATELLCERVVDRWRGIVHPQQRTPEEALLLAVDQEEEQPPVFGTNVETLATEHAASLKLDVDSLVVQLNSLMKNELGGDAHAVFTRLR